MGDNLLADVLRRVLARPVRITHSGQYRWLDIPNAAVSLSPAEALAIYKEFPNLNTEIENEIDNQEDKFYD